MYLSALSSDVIWSHLKLMRSQSDPIKICSDINPPSSKNRKSKFICITLPSLRIAGWEVNIIHFRTSGRLGWVAQKESSRANNEFSWKGQVSTNEGRWEGGGDIYIIRMIYIAN